MSIRNLDAVFKPTSVALIGASNRPDSIGQVLARNLTAGSFRGPVLPVNPKHRSVAGILCHKSVKDLPITPDLAVICTPPHTVPGIIDELGGRGTKGAVVISAGFAELGHEGAELQDRLLHAAQPHLLRVVGPNCLGIMVPGHGLNASFAHLTPPVGDIGFLSQSGTVLTSVIDWAYARGIGFSHLASLGSMADIDFGDMLDYLARDAKTRAIMLYIEAVTEPRKFMSAARAAARTKPVIVIKSGRTASGAKAASSHTGALAGSDDVYDVAFRRAGMLRVADMDELFDAVETLGMRVKVEGERLAVLTNGGGLGVMAADTVSDLDGILASLSDESMEALNASLPRTWSHGNPIDIIGDAPGSRYTAAMDAILKDRGVDAVVVINCPTAIADSGDAARAVVDAKDKTSKPILTSWIGHQAVEPARNLFAEHKIPTYDTPEKAVRAFMHLVTYKRNQTTLMEVPDSQPEEVSADLPRAKSIIDTALEAGQRWLTEYQAKQVLEAYGVPIVETVVAPDVASAVEEATRMGRPVAIKILSNDITHKSDVGGVALHLKTPADVERAATAMLERVSQTMPDAKIDGFTVQEMAQMRGAHELIIGMVEDANFGPVILFGQGGTAVEVYDDKALALPPLNMNLARATIAQTRVNRQLRGYRDRPAADIDGIALTMIKVAQIVTDHPAIDELDINPLFANEEGVLALDARIGIKQPSVDIGSKRLAIRPYPKKLEAMIEDEEGDRYFLRPIKPEDEPLMHEMVAEMDPEDLRLRFFSPVKRLTHDTVARLSQIDYDREMAFVAQPVDGDGTPLKDIAGIVRIAADPDNIRAEYAVIVSSHLKGHGLGRRLMTEIIAYARTRKIGEIYGEVLRENKPMLALCEQLGFSRHASEDEPDLVEVRLGLAD
ncbi:MAG: bifunctional acetate--CoA ligase family protein/GNAT family N-acetyltransferase [Pseudomonadota bacterium]